MSIPMMVTLLVFLILFSAYFSATETAFTSFNRAKMKLMADEGKKSAEKVLLMAEHYDKLLSAILIGNNIVNISASTLATILFVETLQLQNGALISTVVMTLVVLMFGEICPKGLAKEMPERFVLFSAPFLRFLMMILTPLIWFFVGVKKLVSNLIRCDDDRSMSDNELLTLVDEAAQDGGIDKQESELIKSAIGFHDQDAESILTPRVDIIALDLEKDAGRALQMFSEYSFSRLPVYEETIDHIVGILHQRDFFLHPETPVSELMQPVSFVPVGMKISDILKQLQTEKNHMVIVTDEYGGTVGLVTMEDILEELVGEIWDEHDEIVEDLVRIDLDQYRVLCSMSLEKMFRAFDLEMPEDEDSTTVSGWVVSCLDKIPEEGDTFVRDSLAVRVTKVAQCRALEIEVRILPEAPSEDD